MVALALILLSSWVFALTTSAPDSTAYGTQRKLGRDSLGRLHLVWHDNGEIYYSSSDDNGTTWRNQINVSNGGGYSLFPSIAIDSDNVIHVAWQKKYHGLYQIAYSKSSSGETWSAEEIISSGTSKGSFAPGIAVDSNKNLHVAWYEKTGSKFYQVYYRRYWRGLSWGPSAVQVSSGTDYAMFPSIAVDQSLNVHIAWQGGPWRQYRIYYSKFNSVAGTWSASPTALSNPTSLAQYPSIVADSEGNLHVAWMSQPASKAYSNIEYVKYNATTASWDTSPAILSSGSSTASNPSISSHAGNVHVFWQDDNSGNSNILHREFDAEWQATGMLTSTSMNAQPNASISASSRNLDLVWLQGAGPSYALRTSSSFVNHAPAIKLLFPPRGHWVSGSSNRIDFNLSDRDNDRALAATLYYSSTKGARQNLIESLNFFSACSDPDSLSSTDNNCHSDWDTSSLADGNYFIDIVASDSYDTSQASNDSSFAFSIFAPPYAQLDYPNGNETLEGSSADIRFTVQDNNASMLFATIYYSSTKGAKQNLVVLAKPLLPGTCSDPDGTTKTDNACTYNWNLSGVPSGNFFIDLVVYNYLKSALVSSSSSFYRSAGAGQGGSIDLNLVAPLGGETWTGDLNTVYFNSRRMEGTSLSASVYYRKVGNINAQTTESDFSSGATFSQTDTNSDGIVSLGSNGLQFYDSGTYTSKTFDAGTTVQWKYLAWNALKPQGTDLNLQFRTSSDGSAWSEWSQAFTNSQGSFFSYSSRYSQYRANFFTSNTSISPVLLDLNLADVNLDSAPFSGTILASDLNLSSSSNCSSRNEAGFITSNCHYDWNLLASGLSDMQYYAVDLNAYDTNLNATRSSGAMLYRREGAPSVKVIKPNGGETTGGFTYPIDFNVSDPNSRSLHAHLYYSDFAAGFTNLIASIDLNSSYCTDPDLTTRTTNACAFVWEIPQSLDNNVLWIDINVFDGKFSGQDSSDKNFRVGLDLNATRIYAVHPTFQEPEYIAPGRAADINFYYIERNPAEYRIAIQKNGSSACSKSSSGSLVPSPDLNTRIQISETCALPVGTAEGLYDLNLTLIDLAGNHYTTIQYNAVIVDSTSPTFSVSGITETPSYQNDLAFNCSDSMAGCAPAFWYYFSPAESCSSDKESYSQSVSGSALSIIEAHSDYFCAWAEDLAGNGSRILPQKLSIDPGAYSLEQQAVQTRATSIGDVNNYCVLAIDKNLQIDCLYPATIKFRYSPSHVSKAYTGIPRLLVSQPQAVGVLAEKKFASYSNPDYYFNFISEDANLVSGTNNPFVNSVVRRQALPLLKNNGSVKIGTLYIKPQSSGPK